MSISRPIHAFNHIVFAKKNKKNENVFMFLKEFWDWGNKTGVLSVKHC
jgi:hypothetical protein